ncbi:MAG: BT4734/BF3469 family protein [Saprospiraceae bacterium]
MSVITLFTHAQRPKSCLPLINVLYQIKMGKYSPKINSLRKFYAEGKDENYENHRKIIPRFSVAGNFRMRNKQLELISYSGNLLLEIPYLNQRDLKTVKMLVSNDPYVIACFENALGTGLIFIVRSCGVLEEHALMFKHALKYYKSLTGVNHFSPKGKSVAHTCMVSLDEHTYISMEAKSFSKHIKSWIL